MATQCVPNGLIVCLIQKSQPFGGLYIAALQPNELGPWWLRGAGTGPVCAPHDAFSNSLEKGLLQDLLSFTSPAVFPHESLLGFE